MTSVDTGERRRSGEHRPVITELIDEATVQSIAEDAWTALVGEDEFLVPIPGELPGRRRCPAGSTSSARGPAPSSSPPAARRPPALTRALLGDHAPAELEDEDIADAFGEIANVVGGNVKAALPGPSALSLPDVGAAPAVRNPADVCRVDVLWRGEPLSISVQGALPGPAGHPAALNPLNQNGVPL